MADYSLEEIHKGLVILANREACEIIYADYRKPGKGLMTARVLMHGMRSGRMLEITLRGADTLEAADLLEVEV